MGEYLTLLNQVKSYIYNGRTDAARDTLKRLLNSLNMDYTSAKNPADKSRSKNAILKLLPVLDELKAGKVTDISISALSLDRSRLSTGFEKPWQPSAPSPVVPERTAAPQLSAPEKPATGGKILSKSRNPLMPLTFDDYIGQEKAKRSLSISIGAAKKTGRALAHLLICSPYGLGKTTLVNIIANEMGIPFLNVNATNLKDVKALSLYFSKLDQSCIVFIDEIHTLKKEVQTVLLSIMTDFAVSLINEAGEEQTFDIPPFTLVGATTQAGELLKPFLNRFAVIELENYTEKEKLLLINNKFEKLGYTATDEAIAEISRRCRGVPRTIETYVKGVIDVALSRDEKLVTKETTDIFFEIREIDSLGLTKNDLLILRVLDEAKKPLALITVESKCGIQKEDIEYRYEPYLIKIGFIEKTERGRVITKKGHLYLHPEDGGDEEKLPDDKQIPEIEEEPVPEIKEELIPEVKEEPAPEIEAGDQDFEPDDFFSALKDDE